MANAEIIPNGGSLKKIWESLFVSDNPFEWPFSSDIESRMLFYPTEGYHLTETQYSAIRGAAKRVGDKGFLISIIEGQGEVFDRGEHWWCEFPPYEEYLRIPLVLENTHYSKSGCWGIIISHEDHAFIGGKGEFMKEVRDRYSNWQKDWDEFQAFWEDNLNSGWLEGIKKGMN